MTHRFAGAHAAQNNPLAVNNINEKKFHVRIVWQFSFSQIDITSSKYKKQKKNSFAHFLHLFITIKKKDQKWTPIWQFQIDTAHSLSTYLFIINPNI